MLNYISRGKRKDNGEWIKGYLVRGKYWATDNYETAIIELDATFYPMNEIAGYEFVDHKTVGRFTGKLDKYGKPIFEGDIVEALMDYGPAGLYKTVTCINWDENDGWQWEYFELDTIEVIGNIHDHPNIRFGVVN